MHLSRISSICSRIRDMHNLEPLCHVMIVTRLNHRSRRGVGTLEGDMGVGRDLSHESNIDAH